MILESIVISGYRSVPDKLELHVRPRLTCLIGANEHGKSNLLEALNLLDGLKFGDFDRNVNSKDGEHPDIEFLLRLSAEEAKSLFAVVEVTIEDLNDAEDSKKSEERNTLLEARGEYLANGCSHIRHAIDSANTRWLIVSRKDDEPVQIRLADDVRPAPPLKRWWTENVPSVRLFAPEHELADSVSAAELDARKNLPFEGLLRLAGVWENRADFFKGDIVSHRLLDKAGKTLTRKIREIWTQGAKHTIRFDESAGRLHVSIKDPTTFDVPSRRSLGFKTFFAFYLTLFAETNEKDPEGFILLFDEPGVHLHPQGQKDLLREIRKLSKHNQVIYATHSPFMIDRNDPASTLLVTKETTGKSKGTRIVHKSYRANWSQLSAALGISPSDYFFPADRVLLVEGTSDKVYIQTYMGLCQKWTRADLNFLSISDADRREEMEAYLRMLTRAERSVVVLVDGDKGGDDLIKRLTKVTGTKARKVEFLRLQDYLGDAKPVSIEDALPLDEWVTAVNSYVKEVFDTDIDVDPAALTALAAEQTMGRATADLLVEKALIKKPKDFSKVSAADAFMRLKPKAPDKESGIAKLCADLTKKLCLDE